MESFFSRYRNLIVLLAVLVAQVIGLAVQVRKPGPGSGAGAGSSAAVPSSDQVSRDGKSVRLIRLWTAEMVTPFERGFHGSDEWLTGLWTNYIDLRHTKDENRQLQQTIDRLRLEQASILEDARQGQRLQELMKFQENYVYQTMPAQVIGTSGSSFSRVIWLDKGSEDGLAVDMAVITGDGIVGKVREVFPHTAQVLVINDQMSGAGVVLETTRIRGILRGNASGQPQVVNILMDSRIKPGEKVLTAGGDQVFPRGLPVGTVERVDRDPERSSFINILIKPAANLGHLDEVLVVTSLEPHLSAAQRADLKTSEELKGAEVAAEAARKKAAAEMAERLPGLKDPNAPNAPAGAPGSPTADPAKPDGTAVAPPPTPKPGQAIHPDRFSPGGAVDAAPAAQDAPDGGAEDGQLKQTPKPDGMPQKPKSATAPATKPATAPHVQGRAR